MKDNLFIKTNNGSVPLLVNVCKVNANTYKIYNLISDKYMKLYSIFNDYYTDILNITDVQTFIERNKLKPVNENIANVMLKVSSIKKQIQNTITNKDKRIII